jgi:BON domain
MATASFQGHDIATCLSGGGPRGLRPAGVALLLALLSLALATSTFAGEPSATDLYELRLTLAARRALLRDRDLKPQNLFVRVHDGVATVAGPVPSLELATRAVALLTQVRGVFKVRNQTYVERPLPRPAPEEILAEMIQGEQPFGLSSRSLAPDRPEGDSSLPRWLSAPPWSVPEEHFSARPAVPDPEPGESPLQGKPSVSLKPPVSLLRPISEEGKASLLAPLAAALSRAYRPTAEDSSLADQVEHLRTGDPALAELTTEVRAGVVILHGSTSHPDRLMRLAGAVSRLAGVQQVDVSHVRTR